MNKVIGIFNEIDGLELEDFGEMKKRLGLIGSTSQDVGDVELYYSNNLTYAIAHNSEDYYGLNGDRFRFFDLQNKEFSTITNLKEMYRTLLTSYCECGKGYDILDEKDNKMKCRHCKMLNNIDGTPEQNMIDYIKEYEYNVFKEF